MIWNLNVLAAAVALVAGTSVSAASNVVSRTTHKYTFNIEEFAAAPDGNTVNVLGVNNQFDVPIIVNKGDTIQVNAINNLNEPTSLHWHGMFQNGTNWFDGSSMVTQCPIQPGSELTYKFTVNNQHGTYWWHSHAASQYVQGLRGPLIVHDPANEPYTSLYDAEIIVTLTDWFHDDKNTLLAQWFEVNGSGNEPLPDSALINGIGQYNCTQASKKSKVSEPSKHHMMKRDLEERGKKEIAKVAKPPKTKPACVSTPKYTTFSVTPGKRYRFRVINMSAMSTFTFSIDGHKMDVIEADGVDTIKTTVDQVRINVAQRYSVIVNMTATHQDYWFRAIIDTTQYSQNYTTNPQVLAIVHYNSSSTVHPPTTTPTPTPVSLDPFTLLPYSYPDAPANWDIELSLRFDINLYNNVTAALVTLDGIYDSIQYQMPTTTPTLFDVLQNNTLDNSTLPLYIPRGAVVDLTVWNDDTMEHIFHLHGHQFWVLSHGAALNNGVRPSSTQQFPVRDTVAITGCNKRVGHTGEGVCGGGLGYTRIRWIADNPGVWLLHCHMEWHMAAGLAVTLVVDSDGLQANSYKLPGSVQNTCY